MSSFLENGPALPLLIGNLWLLPGLLQPRVVSQCQHASGYSILAMPCQALLSLSLAGCS